MERQHRRRWGVPQLTGCLLALAQIGERTAMAADHQSVTLPDPQRQGKAGFEELVQRRRSVREFSAGSLTLEQVGQLLWAAQGQTDPRGLRAAPSAGALYPLELYLVVGTAASLDSGVYRYRSAGHALEPVGGGDRRRDLARAAWSQSVVASAAAVVVIGGVYQRTTDKYGPRGRRYVHMEAGHVAQNLLLQATALGLNAVPVGAFDDARVRAVVGMGQGVQPLYLLPVGPPVGGHR